MRKDTDTYQSIYEKQLIEVDALKQELERLKVERLEFNNKLLVEAQKGKELFKQYAKENEEQLKFRDELLERAKEVVEIYREVEIRYDIPLYDAQKEVITKWLEDYTKIKSK